MNKTLPAWRKWPSMYFLLLLSILSFRLSAQVSLSCPGDVTVTAAAGASSAVASWADPTASTSCVLYSQPNCSLVSEDIPGFMYMGTFNGSKYYCSMGNDFTWTEARDLAAAAGGYLVTINDEAENEFVRSVIGNFDAWIGYTDEGSEGDFYWANGEDPGYENWKCWDDGSCEPTGGDENYTRILKSDGKWTDRDQWYTSEFVMEIPCPACTAPTISGFIFMGYFNGSMYYCSDGSNFSWNDAVSLSAAAGGHLVTINNASENEFVRNVVGASTVWIGYNDVDSEGNFEWVNGESSDYTNWKSWAPDGGTSQNYVVLCKSDGKWNDKGDNWDTEFVMEIPCSNNGQPGNVTLTQIEGQPSGSAFAIGTHTITYEATDDCGDSQTCSFNVIVNPGQPAQPASVGNFVWSDDNGNGIQDAGEPGVEGVFVMITDCDGNWVNNMLTDANGHYQFDNLAPGTYKIKFGLPTGYSGFAPTDAGTDDALDSDVLPGWTGETACFTLASGENNMDMDAGLIPEPSTYCDVPIVASIDNVQCSNAGTPDDPNDDTFTFDLTVSTGADWGWTGGGVTTDMNNAHTPYNFGPYAISAGQVSFTIVDNDNQNCTFDVVVDAPDACSNGSGGSDPGSVGDFVWSDDNANGIQDPGEPGIAGVWVMITDCDGNFVNGMNTDANGYYQFDNLPAGTYKVKFALAAGYTGYAPTDAGTDDEADSDVLPGWTGYTDCFTLGAGEYLTGIDAGFVPETPTGGTCDNLTSPGEIAGEQTICAGEDAAPLTNVELPSGGSGAIEYMWLAAPGTDCPNGMADAIPGANGPTYDPGVLTETTTFRRCARRAGCDAWVGESNCITITVDQSPNCSGGSQPGSVGDFVWSDDNGNGIQDAGEQGIPGVFVMITDCDGNWVNNMVTDADGHYQFDNLAPGTYKVKFALAAGYTGYAPTDAGTDDEADSDVLPGWTGFTACFTLGSGENLTGIDAGFIPENTGGGTCDNLTSPGEIAGEQTICAGEDAAPLTNVELPSGGSGAIEYMWLAAPGTDCPNSMADAIPGADGPSYDPGVLTETTTFRRCARRAGCDAWVGESNCITITVDQSPNCGGGGSQPGSVGDFVWSDDNGNGIQDAGEQGIPGVFVMITDCDGNWVNNMVTDADGHYQFDNLAPGTYKVKFALAAGYSGYAPTDAGTDDEADSDVLSGWTGYTACFTLGSGENLTGIDAGFIPEPSTSCDVPIVASIDNVQCSNAGTPNDPNDDTFTFDLTVSSGADWGWTGGGVTTDMSNAHTPYTFGPYAISAGQVSFTIVDNDNQYCTFDVVVDAPNTCSNGGGGSDPGSVGDFVWSDDNGNGIQDPGEPGIPGVWVMITDCDGNFVNGMNTDANGHYQFDNLPAGTYKVKFALAAGYTGYAPTDAGTDDEADSDVLPGWTGFTDCFTLGSGENLTGIDAGFIPDNTGGGTCDNLTSAGYIAGEQTICAGEDAAPLTNVELPSGGSGAIEYMWLAKPGTDCPNDISYAIPGADGPSYDPGVLTETTTFRRCARRAGCDAWVGESNCVTVTVDQSPNCGGPAVCTTRDITDLLQCNGTVNSTFWAEDLVYGLPNVDHNYHLISGGTFTEYEDGTAHFSAVVENNTNSSVKFALDFTLTGKTAYNDNPHAPYCFSSDMNDWYYYTSMSGTITGMDALEGAVINGVHTMYLPQLGTGANLHEDVFGFTSWVELTVVSQPNDPNVTLDDNGTAHADLNFNLSGDPSTCAPEATTCATREVWDAYQCNLGLDYAFFAMNLIDQFGDSPDENHYEERGYSEFVEYTDGTAHLSMKVRNHDDHGIKFQIELDFSGRTFSTPADASDAEYCYTPDKSDWYYYTNVTGTITGLADMAGAEINVWNVMHPFQIGTGAALFGDWDDFGGTTWLGYEVVSQPYNYYTLSEGGNMDLNIHMDGDATACGGNDYTASTARIMDLAIEQDEFTATLTWQNNTGDVNNYFIVERSNDGNVFTPIAQVESEVTEQGVVSTYNYRDLEPVKGTNYYRVIAVTKDNKKLVSNKAQAIFGDREGVTLFPNPAGEYVMIDLLPFKGQAVTITISNRLGQVITTVDVDEAGAAPLRVNLNDFVNGYYNVMIQTANGDYVTKKLVVTRLY